MPIQRARWCPYACMALVAAILVAGLAHLFGEQEIPIVAIGQESDVVLASYWAPHAPRVRLEATVDREGKQIFIRAFQSYSPLAWISPMHQKSVTVPNSMRDYQVRIAWTDMTQYE